MIQTIKTANKLTFLDRCQKELHDTDPPVACHHCGEIKKDFVSPMEAHQPAGVVVIDCDCERRYKALFDFYHEYRQLKIGDHAYGKLIDGTIHANTLEEKEIADTGQKIRQELGL